MPNNFTRGHASVYLVCTFCLLLVAGILASGAAERESYIPTSSENHVCAICHNCDFPTQQNLCLNKEFCIRAETDTTNGSLPEHGMMILDELEKVYDPVLFNHGKHAQMSEMTGGCENCHHFAPPTTEHPACKECHAPNALHSKIQPGLKAAYHRHCLSCHNEWDTETHCELCHYKKVGGKSTHKLGSLPYRKHTTPLVVKDLIVFDTGYEGGEKVPFHHLNHVQKYDRDCSVCHENEGCSSCHVHGSESHPLGLLSDVDLHDTCYKCHDKKKGCNECHGRNRNDLFNHSETGWDLQPYHAVLQCKDCHHKRGRYSANDKNCVTCHIRGWDEEHFNHGITGVVLDDIHKEMGCASCHVGGVGHHSRCDECHADGRKWDRKASFGPGSE